MMALAATCPQESSADGFTGNDFATWSVASQESYIQTALTMAGVVLTQTNPDAATCMNDRFFKDDRLAAQIATIQSYVVQHGDAHPAGVIMAVITRECSLN